MCLEVWNPGQDAQYLTYVVFVVIFFIALRGTIFLKRLRIDDIWKYSLIIVGTLVLLNRALFHGTWFG